MSLDMWMFLKSLELQTISLETENLCFIFGGGFNPNPNILLLDKQVFIAGDLWTHTHTSPLNGLLLPAV